MRLWKGIVCGLVILGFCSFAPQSRAVSANTATQAGYGDESIERTLRDTLNQNPAFGQVEPSVSHGIVTLTGSVAHYQDKIDAENAARQMPGVHNVRSQISLTTPVADDLELEERVEDTLRFARADAGLSFPQIQVEAHKGVVYLTGTVKDPIEHAAALTLVGDTDGVFSVRDKLSIEPALQNDEAARVRINKAIYRATRANGEIGIGGIVPVRASFNNGTVTLMGSVADAKTKDELMSKIRDVYGVLTIDDEVIVRNTAPAIQQTALHTSTPCTSNKEVATANH
jgi:hyperosmotically inducible periplasmic protein